MNILEALNSFNDKQNKYFVYYLSKLRTDLESEKNAIIQMSMPSQDFIDFEKERRMLVSKYAEIVDGNPIEKNGMYKVKTGSEEDCQKELSTLFEMNKDVLRKRQEELVELEKIMQDEIEINITPIPFGHVPDLIDPKVFEIIKPVVKIEENE